MTYSFPNLELVHCSMSGSNCCFLTHIQVSQEADKVVWYSQLFKNFLQFFVIYTVKGLNLVNEEVMFFWNSLAFSMLQQMLDIWSLVPLLLLNPACTSGSSPFMDYWSLAWRILSITLLACEMSAFFGIAFLWDWNENWPFSVCCGHCWVFQICWHIECSTLTAPSIF